MLELALTLALACREAEPPPTWREHVYALFTKPYYSALVRALRVRFHQMRERLSPSHSL